MTPTKSPDLTKSLFPADFADLSGKSLVKVVSTIFAETDSTSFTKKASTSFSGVI
uniref:Uncharacterized protein n=1 Tax=Hyaloperonospora arabidopsidis (strain Emoy2) TaxID=559515 RepID=M4C0E9_HYAAE